MKSYKQYNKVSLGASDIASLTVRSGREVKVLDFGQDEAYSAYVVDENAEIGAHYHPVMKFTSDSDWGVFVWIYDDEGRVYKSPQCEEIIIYRAGEMGCVIQLKGVKEQWA